MLYLCCTYLTKIACKLLIYTLINCDSVTPEGLEPPTNRTGICHSIQLNYGARAKYELRGTIDDSEISKDTLSILQCAKVQKFRQN